MEEQKENSISNNPTPEGKKAREYNSPIIQELIDEITPEEMEACNQRMLQEQMLQELVDALDNQHDLDPEFGKIIFENYDDLI